MRNFYRFVGLSLLLCLQLACSAIPKYPVEAEFLEETIKTTVDSEIAQYYLNDYLQGNKYRPDFDLDIDRAYQQQRTPLPNREFLRQTSQDQSLDFAALFLADRLWSVTENRLLQRDFHRFMEQTKADLYTAPATGRNYIVLFVPGWNYVNNGPITGSDFALPRKLLNQLGMENYLVEIPSTGSVYQSADVISETILRHSMGKQRIIIVGASAAGPAIHYTLGKQLSAEQLGSVAAWINLGGILKGSPLIDYFQRWPQKAILNLAGWILGWDNDEIMTMSTAQSRARFSQLEVPDKMVVINYLGLSLSGDLSHLSTFKYPLIADQGPNDGLTQLIDIIAPNSMTLVATRSDHYFGEDPLINDKTIAILKTTIEYIENR